MVDRRSLLILVVLMSLLALGGVALAKTQHHNDGHDLLGAKLDRNGKHEIDKIGLHAVTAEVNNKKVVNMAAGPLSVRKVKSRRKMAGFQFDEIKIAANGEIQIAQASDYYGYCFDATLDVYCYWYPASDVITADFWAVYSPI